jgi:hypothetical protein
MRNYIPYSCLLKQIWLDHELRYKEHQNIVHFRREKQQSSVAFLLIQALRYTILDVHCDVLTREQAFSKGTKILTKSENVD